MPPLASTHGKGHSLKEHFITQPQAASIDFKNSIVQFKQLILNII